MNLSEFLEKFKHPGDGLLFAKVWGSNSHNTNKQGSDTDFAGVYFYNTSKLLSCRYSHDEALQETWKYDQERADIKLSKANELIRLAVKDKEQQPDFQFHEVGRFCDLLLIGNPGIVEMLFTDRMIVSSASWEKLRSIRNKFLSQEVVKQYIGYMQSQMRRLVAHDGQRGLHTKGGAYNEKWAYHIVRLAEDARRIATGDFPQVWKEGEEREFLMRIRNGEFSWEEIQEIIKRSIQSALNTNDPMPVWEDKKGYEQWMDKALAVLPLPKYGDKEALNNWLLDFRKENW